MIIMKIFLSCSRPNQLTHCQELSECNDNEGSEEAAGFRGGFIPEVEIVKGNKNFIKGFVRDFRWRLNRLLGIYRQIMSSFRTRKS